MNTLLAFIGFVLVQCAFPVIACDVPSNHALRGGMRNAADLLHINGGWRCHMLSWAALFLVIAIIAGVLGLTGVAGMSMQIAWILFIVGIVLAIVFFFIGRRPRI